MKNKFIITILLSILCTTSFAFAANNINNTIGQKPIGVQNNNKSNLYSYEGYKYQMNNNESFDNSQLSEGLIQEKTRKLSNIEKLFNPKDINLDEDTILRQVGYDLFTTPAGLKGNTTGKFNPNYKLSVGEKVSLYLYF